MSFFSPRYGFACDNVVNYEVVIPSGALVNVNITSYPDLFYALKGGSNNFGIVTRFDLKAFPQGKFWGGFVAYTTSTRKQFFAAFENLNGAADYDPYVAIIHSYTFVAALRLWVSVNNFEYTKPVVEPPVLKPFYDIKPRLYSTMRISNLSDFAIELNKTNGAGHR
jgi:FAD/FMN-containing dehydrogenase